MDIKFVDKTAMELMIEMRKENPELRFYNEQGFEIFPGEVEEMRGENDAQRPDTRST